MQIGIGIGVTQQPWRVPMVTPPTGAVLMMPTGQSNSRVAGNSAATPPTRYTDGSLGEVYSFVPGASSSDATGTFEPYNVATNADPDNSGAAWGSEAEIIYQMRQAGDMRPVYVVKCSRNGQNLYDQWHPATAGGMFDRLRAKIARARALLAAASVTISEELCIWNQGEADANVGAGPGGNAASNYATNFAAWLAALRAEISTGTLIVQRIRPLGYDGDEGVTTPEGVIRAGLVREAQVAAQSATVKTIDTDFITSNFNNIHPLEPWTEGMAIRSYAAWKGTYDATYGAIGDTTPAAFVIPDIVGATVSTVTASTAVLIGGIERRSPITVSGCEWRTLNSMLGDHIVHDWTTAAGYVDKFQKVQLRLTSSASNETGTSATVTIGGVSDTWTVTTEAAGVTLEAETTAFIATLAANSGGAMNGSQRATLNDLFIGLKADNLLTKLRSLRLHGMHDQVAANIDLVDQTTLAVDAALAGGVVPWTVAGYNPAGATQRAHNLVANPSTEASQNNLMLGGWFTGLTADADLDLQSNGNVGMRVQTTAARAQMFSGNVTVTGLTNTDGFYAFNRIGSADTRLYGPAGTQLGATQTTASAAPTATTLQIGGPLTSDRTCRASFMGTGFVAADVLALRNRLVAFFASF